MKKTRIIEASVDISANSECHNERNEIRSVKRKNKKYSKQDIVCKDFNYENKIYCIIRRIFDRENDEYYERIEDEKTGECLRCVEEPLSKHTDHGDAKKKI